jgi:aldehyde:ferredoxin oxidoreductase
VGKGSTEVEEILKNDLGQEFQILTIGEAGERMVHFACISHDFGRQAGRTGIGAVLGSKNIKAIAVRGTQDIPVFDPRGCSRKAKPPMPHAVKNPGSRAGPRKAPPASPTGAMMWAPCPPATLPPPIAIMPTRSTARPSWTS